MLKFKNVYLAELTSQPTWVRIWLPQLTRDSGPMIVFHKGASYLVEFLLTGCKWFNSLHQVQQPVASLIDVLGSFYYWAKRFLFRIQTFFQLAQSLVLFCWIFFLTVVSFIHVLRPHPQHSATYVCQSIKGARGLSAKRHSHEYQWIYA